MCSLLHHFVLLVSDIGPLLIEIKLSIMDGIIILTIIL